VHTAVKASLQNYLVSGTIHWMPRGKAPVFKIFSDVALLASRICGFIRKLLNKYLLSLRTNIRYDIFITVLRQD
jgi:hypothetical protein